MRCLTGPLNRQASGRSAQIARCRAGNILFDGTRFARSLERVYVRMIERSAAGLAPEGFDFEP